jgi:iron-sulfur cluster assembly protein
MSAKPSVMNVSPTAAERVRGLLAKSEPGVGLRVSLEKSGCAGVAYRMALAEPEQGDEVIDFEGGRVIVDAKAVLYLLGTTMDVKTSQFESSFVFENPNQTSACGCGESVELQEADPARLAPTA